MRGLGSSLSPFYPRGKKQEEFFSDFSFFVKLYPILVREPDSLPAYNTGLIGIFCFIGMEGSCEKNDQEKSMSKNGFWMLLLFGGVELLAVIVGPYQHSGGRNTSPKYGKSRNDRIPPSYKQSVAVAAAFFAMEVIFTFIGVTFFDLLSDRVRRVLCICVIIAVVLELVVSTVIVGVHEHLEKRWHRITKGKKHFTQKELREYEDLLYHRKRRGGKKGN